MFAKAREIDFVKRSPNSSLQLFAFDPTFNIYFSIFIQQVAKHLAHTYGTKAPEVAKLANITGSRWPVVGKRLVEQFPYIEAEIRYGVQEYACTIVDFLARRTRLAFLNAQAAADAIPKIADIMAKEMNWSKDKKEVNRRESNLVPSVSHLPVPWALEREGGRRRDLGNEVDARVSEETTES